MATGVVKDLLSRRVPQILGIYLAISWGIVEFVGLLVDRYLLSPHLLTFGMVGLASMIPTVLLLAYFHGKPGADRWARTEKIGIPANLLASVALLLFMFSGKDLGGAAGPDSEIIGPAFDHNETAKPGHGGGDGTEGGGGKALLFKNPSFTCADGATDIGQGSFGHVSWGAIFVGEAVHAGDHIHYELHLEGVDAGDYTIFGNQAEDPNCDGANGETVDIGTVKVMKNGRVVSPGNFQFEFPKHDAGGLTTHVWVTVSGPGGIFRSPAVEVVIPPHVEVQ